MNRRTTISSCINGLIFVAVFFSPLRGEEMKLTPSLGYEYVTGLHGYYSHGATGGLAFALPNRDRFSAYFSVLKDRDYSRMHSFNFQYKKRMDPDWKIGAGLLRSSGKIKGSDDDGDSTSLDLKSIHALTDAIEGTLGYRYTRGVLTVFQMREVATGVSGTRIEPFEDQNKFKSHTFSGILDHWALLGTRSLFSAVTLSATYHGYDDSWTLTEGIEASYEWMKDLFGGVAYTLAQNKEREEGRYVSFSLTKYF